jgi:hypothetical protein
MPAYMIVSSWWGGMHPGMHPGPPLDPPLFPDNSFFLENHYGDQPPFRFSNNATFQVTQTILKIFSLCMSNLVKIGQFVAKLQHFYKSNMTVGRHLAFPLTPLLR